MWERREEEEEEEVGRETVPCVQFPVIMFCLMEFIQLAPLEQIGGSETKQKCIFISSSFLFFCSN